jgi:hypothetical protein
MPNGGLDQQNQNDTDKVFRDIVRNSQAGADDISTQHPDIQDQNQQLSEDMFNNHPDLKDLEDNFTGQANSSATPATRTANTEQTGSDNDAPNLAAAEASNNAFNYSPKKDHDKNSIASKAKKKRRNKVIMIVAAIAAIICLFLILFELFKTEFVAELITEGTKISIDYMVTKRTQAFIASTWANLFFPEARFCDGDITPTCIARFRKTNPFHYMPRFMQKWLNDQLEEKFLKGVKITYNAQTKYYRVTRIDPETGEVSTESVSADTADNPEAIERLILESKNKYEVFRVVAEELGFNSFVGKITSYFVAKFLEWKYHLPLCFFACNAQEFITNKLLSINQQISQLKEAALGLINDKVIQPIVQSGASQLIQCMLSPSVPCANEDGADEAGNDVLADEADAAAEAATETVTKAAADDVAAQGAKQFADTLVGRVLVPLIGERATNAIPIVGQVILAIQVTHAVGKFVSLFASNNPSEAAIPKILWNKLFKIPQAIAANQNLQSAAAEPVASLNGGISPGVYGVEPLIASDSLTDGVQDSKLYQYIAGSQYNETEPRNTATVSECPDGSTTPAASLLPDCMRLDQNPPIIDVLRNHPDIQDLVDAEDAVINNPIEDAAYSIITTILNDTAGALINLIIKVPVLNLPFKLLVDGLGWVIKESLPTITKMLELIFPPMYESIKSLTGASLFDGAYVGSQYTNYEYATGGIQNGVSYGLGGYDLNAQQSNNLISDADQMYQQDENSQSLTAKLFSISDPNSLFGRLTLYSPMPTSSSTLTAMLDPINILAFPLSVMQSVPTHALLMYPSQDTSGIPLVGFATNDSIWGSDPANDPTDSNGDCQDNRQTNGLNAIGETNYTTGSSCIFDNTVSDVLVGGTSTTN